jgi:DNA-3-methyladenine glycosylase
MVNKLKDKKYAMNGSILDAGFYERDTAVVAEGLIGKLLVRKYTVIKPALVLSGIITETEAYYGSDDPASHAYRGITKRSGIMFGRPGIAYVYFCYGAHYMLNAVTEIEGVPGAVLIRAARPVAGIKTMMENRKVSDKGILANGPGKLAQAFGIDLEDNGTDLTVKNSFLNICNCDTGGGNIKIKRSSRVGLSRGQDRKLRFMLEGQ